MPATGRSVVRGEFLGDPGRVAGEVFRDEGRRATRPAAWAFPAMTPRVRGELRRVVVDTGERVGEGDGGEGSEEDVMTGRASPR